MAKSCNSATFFLHGRPWVRWLFLVNAFCLLIISGNEASSQNESCPIAPAGRASYPYYVSTSVRELHEDLYAKVFQVILDEGIFFNNNQSRAKSPFQFKTKSELRDIIDFSLPQTRTSHEDLLKVIRQVIEYSPHPSHPYKVDRHGAGLDPYGLVGEWMGTLVASPVLTYLIGPVVTLMEYEVEKHVRILVYGSEEGDGMVTPGVAAGCGYAMQMALRQRFPDLKQHGFAAIGSPKPVMFVSDQGSFFYEKYAIWEGLGSNGIVRVATCSQGRMNVTDLKLKIEEAKSRGQIPFMVVGTAGTPILGAIDPLDEIATVASENGLWFHVQGFLAGSLFLSKAHRHRIKGVERSDSFLWSADKGLNAPYVSDVLVTPKKGMLLHTFGYGSKVLFFASPLYDSFKWDKGDATLQCTRRPAIFKLWFMWKAKGHTRLAKHVDYTIAMSKVALSQLEKRSPSFQLVLPDFESHQVAFYYTPSSLQTFPKDVQRSILAGSKYTERLKAVLLQKGILSISVNTLPGYHGGLQFFVMNLGNSILTELDVAYILDQIAYHGELLPVSGEAAQLNSSSGTNAMSIPIPPPEPASSPDFVSAPIESMHKEFISQFFQMARKDAIFWEEKRQGTPYEFNTPLDLLTKFNFSLGNPDGAGSMITNENDLLDLLRKSALYTGHMSHPLFIFHLIYGLNPYTAMADFIISTINSPMTTYEDNPVFTIMQEEVVKAVGKRIGFSEECEGLMLPGGSAGNELAIHQAYMRRNPEAKEGGVAAVNKSMVVFCSAGAHYSTPKGGFFSGLGLDNVVRVSTDKRGRMSMTDLRKKILTVIMAEKVPLMVTATIGSTVLGAFDPVDEIAAICQEYNMWLHVDGAYGGSSIMSPPSAKKESRLRGIEKADSFTFNPHKVFLSAKETTITILNHKGFLDEVSPPPSEQEFNNQILYNGKTDDLGRRQFFPDRRENVFKIWFLWKALGVEGLGEHVEYGLQLTEQVHAYIKAERSAEFILHNPNSPPDFLNVNMFYVPRRFRTRADHSTKTFWDDLSSIQLEIMRLLIIDGRVVIAPEDIEELPPPFFILPLLNSAMTLDDAKHILDVIDFYGRDL